MILGGAIPKQRQRHGAVLGPVDNRLIHAIKHQIHIRYHPRIPLEKLQQPPYREHRSALHARVKQVHVELPRNDYDTESREFLGFSHMGRRNPGHSPGLEVVVDPPEEIWACLARLRGVKTVSFGGGVGVGG